MSKGTGVFAIACWCFAAAAANAQYGPVPSGQPAMGQAVPPSADYYSNYNAYQRRLAANGGAAAYAPATTPNINNPMYGGWAVNNANPGTRSATGFPYNTGRTNLAAAQVSQGSPTPAFPEQSPADLLTGNQTQALPNFQDPANTTMIGPGNLAPGQSGGTQDPNLNQNQAGPGFNPGTQGFNNNPGFGNDGGCATGNCGPSCAPCCRPRCCAGRMGPGPLFGSGSCCGCLSFMKGCFNDCGMGGCGSGMGGGYGGGMGGMGSGMGGMGSGMGGYGGGMGAYGGGMGGGYGAGMGGCGGGMGAGGYGGGAGGYGSPFQQAVGGAGFGGGCGSMPGMSGYIPVGGFYAQAGALFLHRDKANPVWTTFDETNLNNQLMNTQQAAAGTGYGGQITIGHCLGCNHAIEATYWGLSNMTGSSSIVSPTNAIGTPLDLSFLPNFSNGNPPGNYFDGAHEHAIWRKDTVQNVEINVLGYPSINPCTRFRVAALGGFRCFTFTDQLIFGSAAANTNFGDNNGATEAFLYTKTTNTLLGFQIGARLSYFLTPRFALFAVPKVGFYNNHMTQNTGLYTGDGLYNFNLQSSANGVSTLSELDLGGQFYVTPRFAVFAAYRMVNVTGVALADNVIPHYLNDAPAIQTINRNGNLILQGLYTGVQWNF